MTISSSNPVAKDALLKRLSVWATQQDLLEDPYVINLIKDISEDRNLSFWADQDPLTLIPAVSSKKGQGLIRASRFFSVFRNVLVFLPVALTWKAISDATRGFAQFTAQSDSTPVNFLEFWQNGYGYINEFWTISNVAILDFWIIMFVIFITLLANSFASNGQRIYEVTNEALDVEKLAIVIEIKKYLFNAKPHKIENINQDVINSIERLNQGMREFNKTSENIELLSDYLSKAVPQVQLVHENMNKTATSNNRDMESTFADFTKDLSQALTQLNNWAYESQQGMKNMAELLQDSMNSYMQNTNEQIKSINENIQGVTNSNSEELAKIFGNFTQDLSSGINQLNSFVLDLQESVKEVRNLLGDIMSSSVSNMTTDINSANKYITKSARQLESELDSLSSQINKTAASIKAQRENQD